MLRTRVLKYLVVRGIKSFLFVNTVKLLAGRSRIKTNHVDR